MLQKSRERYQNLPGEEKKIKHMVAKNIKIFQKMKKCQLSMEIKYKIWKNKSASQARTD